MGGTAQQQPANGGPGSGPGTAGAGVGPIQVVIVSPAGGSETAGGRSEKVPGVSLGDPADPSDKRREDGQFWLPLKGNVGFLLLYVLVLSSIGLHVFSLAKGRNTDNDPGHDAAQDDKTADLLVNYLLIAESLQWLRSEPPTPTQPVLGAGPNDGQISRLVDKMSDIHSELDLMSRRSPPDSAAKVDVLPVLIPQGPTQGRQQEPPTPTGSANPQQPDSNHNQSALAPPKMPNLLITPAFRKDGKNANTETQNLEVTYHSMEPPGSKDIYIYGIEINPSDFPIDSGDAVAACADQNRAKQPDVIRPGDNMQIANRPDETLDKSFLELCTTFGFWGERDRFTERTSYSVTNRRGNWIWKVEAKRDSPLPQ